MNWKPVCFVLLFVVLTQAAVRTVTNSDDDVFTPGTLRNLVSSATFGDTIVFANSMTIVLQAPLVIDLDLEIDGDVDGNGNPDVTISGSLNSVRVFKVVGGVELSLNGLILSGVGSQGGIVSVSASTLKAKKCFFQNSQSSDNGGAIFATGSTVDIKESAFQGNTANVMGGAISLSGGTAIFLQVLFDGNEAPLGGGVALANGAAVSVTDSTWSGNRASAASGAKGGAIGCLDGHFSLEFCTLANNAVTTSGVGNGVYLAKNCSFETDSSLYANGGSDIINPNGGTVTSQGYNLLSQSLFSFKSLTDVVGASSLEINLGPLKNNGGITKTHALLPSSVAIDLIPFVCSDVDCTDQRGSGFPRPVGLKADVGAYEAALAPARSSSPNLPTTSASPSPTCGNGIVDAGEECDSSSSCCSGKCTFKRVGKICGVTKCEGKHKQRRKSRCDRSGVCKKGKCRNK